LSDGDSHNINSVALLSEFRVLGEIIPEGIDDALQASRYLKSLHDSFLKTETAYRIMLTVPITVASEDNILFENENIQNYLKTTIAQERLGGWAVSTMKTEVASSIDYNNIIARNSRKVISCRQHGHYS
jgi:hypothetical protein